MPTGFHRRQSGVTLVELVIFMVVAGIAVTGVLLAFAATERGTPTAAEMAQARQLAEERIELVLAQKPVLGFNCFNAPLFDPCESAPAAPPCPGRTPSTAAVCGVPSGYSVAATLAAAGGARKTVTVQVQGPGGALLATLVSEVDAD